MQRQDDECEPGPQADEITVAQAARLTGYSLAHVRWLAAQGRVKARKLTPRCWLLSAEDLLKHKARMSGPWRMDKSPD